MPTVDLRLGDCLDVLRTLPDASVDAVVTDPPAGISFMGANWDRDKGGRDQWIRWLAERMAEARRVSKPGAYALVWALPRTSHWTATAVEDAGWRVVDRVAHVFGSGFPKHKSKLKPAVEDWWLAWNPDRRATELPGLDRCRVDCEERPAREHTGRSGNIYGAGLEGSRSIGTTTAGRWPPNLLLSHHPDCGGECVEGCPVRLMGEQSGDDRGSFLKRDAPGQSGGGGRACYGEFGGRTTTTYGDTGTAARFFPNFRPDADPFFYCPKASRSDRGEFNTHATVKSTDLMRWLVRLITPRGGVVLDCFMGSGSTGKAAALEGVGFVGIEQDADYHAIARRRIDAALAETPLLNGTA
jgi:hypothetical protein